MRKRYLSEFKSRVALEAICGEQTPPELASKYGVHQTMIAQRKRQAVAGKTCRRCGEASREDREVVDGMGFSLECLCLVGRAQRLRMIDLRRPGGRWYGNARYCS